MSRNWSEDEKKILIDLWAKLPGKWDDIATKMKPRTALSCEAMYRRIWKGTTDVPDQIQTEWSETKTKELLEWLFEISKNKIDTVSDGLKCFPQKEINDKLDSLKYHLSCLVSFSSSCNKTEKQSNDTKIIQDSEENNKSKQQVKSQLKPIEADSKNKGSLKKQGHTDVHKSKDSRKAVIAEEAKVSRQISVPKRNISSKNITENIKPAFNGNILREKLQATLKINQVPSKEDAKVDITKQKKRIEKATYKQSEINEENKIDKENKKIADERATKHKDAIEIINHILNPWEWSHDEDTKLIEYHHTLGNKWNEISKMLRTKTEKEVEDHFYEIMVNKAEKIYLNQEKNEYSIKNRKMFMKNPKKATRAKLDKFARFVYMDYGIIPNSGAPIPSKQLQITAIGNSNKDIGLANSNEKPNKPESWNRVDEAMKFIKMLSNINQNIPEEVAIKNQIKAKKNKSKKRSVKWSKNVDEKWDKNEWKDSINIQKVK